MNSNKIKRWTPLSILALLVLCCFAVICVAPFVYMVIMSFTQSTTLIIHARDVDFTDFSNFVYVFTKSNFVRALINSIVVVGCSCFFNCLIASMAAYGFEKKNFPGKEALFRV